MAQFIARARALDMLGRQQIAGIPTAITELFKNAHDAYADNVIVDYFRNDGLFVLRDDGLGMTRNDFEDRWLTLGTESKLANNKSLLPPADLKKTTRPIMGEKGIGRLAIASIGNHVLVLTRAKREDGLHNLVVSFVFWKLFEIPGINLNHITIPLREIENGILPTKSDIDSLLNEVRENILDIQREGYLETYEANLLFEQLNNFSFDIHEVYGYLGYPSLANDGFGTHFFICPADDILNDLIDGNKANDKASPLLKTLIGFTNTMVPNHKEPAITASFRDHKTDEYYDDLIADNEFWTPNEFVNADHHIAGFFDEFGQFKGDITVYGENFFDHVVPWADNKGFQTQCGSFKIDLAYIQGNPSDTSLEMSEYQRISNKLEKISGLYLYKDGIRILPYGDNSVDFLNIEERRTKGNDYYYFSYRRMFGVIEISKKNNPNLIEKAGREGLRENKAYKEFKSILENFFIQLAADFFRSKKKGGSNIEYWEGIREDLKRKYVAKQEYEKKAKAKKEKFIKDLDRFFNYIRSGIFFQDFEDQYKDTQNKLLVCRQIKDNDTATAEFLRIENTSKIEFENIKSNFKVIKPKGVALSKKQLQDYDLYLIEYEKLIDKDFKNAETKLAALLNEYSQNMVVKISRRKRLEASVEQTIKEYQTKTSKEVKETQEVVKKINDEVVNLAKMMFKDYEAKIRNVKADLARIEPYKLDDNGLVEERTRLESILIADANSIKDTLDDLKNQLNNISISKEYTSIDLTEGMAEELDTLRAKVDADLELSQLGLAVSAIQHEFNHTTQVVKSQIRKLKAWADVNEGLDGIYNILSTNFEHLDNYLTLFQPLSRRLYRKKIEIYGSDIFEFVKEVFYARIDKNRHNISFEKTPAFSKNIIIGYPSTFYPVFVNIVDNAIFWLKDQDQPRKLILDADANGIYLSNNGPQIDIREWKRIFELGFTRKPMGRGMGLYISKEVLNKVSYDIELVAPRLGKGVTFRIFKMEEKA